MANMNNEDFVAFNQYNSQMSAITSQKNQLKMIIDNTNSAIKELKESKEDFAYKNLGFFMLKVEKSKLVKDLESEIENVKIRIKTLEKSEELVAKKLDELRSKLETQMQNSKKE